MRYKIYIMDKPEHLQKTVPDGYHLKTIEKTILQTPDYNLNLDDDYSSPEDAYLAISNNENIEELKGYEFCILPVVSVHWDGEIK